MSKLWLPDVNVLFSLAWPEAAMHGVCLAWFRSASGQGWATCTLTESGLMRLSMNPRLIPPPVYPRDVVTLLDMWREMPGHRFLPMDIPLTVETLPLSRLKGYRQVTDAVLLALARAQDACLVTLDEGLSDLCVDETWKRSLFVLSR